jgi:hypothetical protein
MASVTAALRDLARAFADVGARWYVFGAQAAIVYGSTRVTEDIDVTVDLGETSTTKLVRSLSHRGIRSRVANPAAFVKRARVLPFVHEKTGLPIDIVLAGPGLEEQFMARAETHVRQRLSFPVARAEDVVVMKLLAGRPRDHEDVAAIVRARGKALDATAIKSLLADLEQALDQSDLLEAFDDAIKVATRKRAKLPPHRG